MISGFSQALSGLQANSQAISVIGNDLANLNTTGYKANQVEFHDLLSTSLGVSGTQGQLGMGVGPVAAVANYTQGSLQTTNGATDAAIQGDGFFVLHDANTNQTLYTRDGSFNLNQSGQLVTQTGQLVQGWTAVNGVVNTGGAVGNITLPVGTTVPATATSTMNLALNLDARVATTDPGAVVTAPIQVYDSQGVSHDLTATFTKTGVNTWSYAVTIPGADLAAPPAAPLASGNLTFDANGNLSAPALAADPQTFAIAGLADGAADMNVAWNLYSNGSPTISQYASATSVTGTTQNGFAAGSISGVALQTGGQVIATFTNGQKVAVGQIAMASVINPSSLAKVGDNNLAATASTSTPVIGAANTGDRGQIVAGAIESSTVDIATEFTNLLTFQRGYQADSRVITTADQLAQETVNLIHS